jgi:hypothetical protein
MPHFIKNNNLEIQIDLPAENYTFSRFDWTGKIVSVKFQDHLLTSSENTDSDHQAILGKGLFNEFGIDTPLGFTETPIGGWFHKIGVGLLKKEDALYQCSKKYAIRPAKFHTTEEPKCLFILCESEAVNGYSYILEKRIALEEHGFTIAYSLHNTGTKKIMTDEYVHNFLAIDKDPIGSKYSLHFPFQLETTQFIETVNPEQKVLLGKNKIAFTDTVNKTFFFSNLSGDKSVTAQWELKNKTHNIAIRETGSFETAKVNLWGTKHVVSPELFLNIALVPGAAVTWSRTYELSKTT